MAMTEFPLPGADCFLNGMIDQEEGEWLFSGSRGENPVSRTSGTIGKGNENI